MPVGHGKPLRLRSNCELWWDAVLPLLLVVALWVVVFCDVATTVAWRLWVGHAGFVLMAVLAWVVAGRPAWREMRRRGPGG